MILKKNCKFIISYDGTRYYGWEHQPDIELTVQGKIEAVLERLAGEPVEILGAGRTDAGVHAKGMVAHCFLDNDMSENEIRDYMNKYLPEDIAILKVIFAADRFHSRYNATGKTYCYTLAYGPTKPIFDRKYVWYIQKKPDIDAMRNASKVLMGEHDFAAFCANPRFKKSTVRTVDKIDIIDKQDRIKIYYHGNGFLQHMVRILTGTLLDVGYHKKTLADIENILKSKDRKLAGDTAPSQGLCLIEVDYS